MKHEVPPKRWKRLGTLQGFSNLKYHHLTKEVCTILTQWYDRPSHAARYHNVGLSLGINFCSDS